MVDGGEFQRIESSHGAVTSGLDRCGIQTPPGTCRQVDPLAGDEDRIRMMTKETQAELAAIDAIVADLEGVA